MYIPPDELDYIIDDLLSALDDVQEAREALAQARSEYTGYSPGYALEPWYESERKAKNRLKTKLIELIQGVPEKEKR